MSKTLKHLKLCVKAKKREQHFMNLFIVTFRETRNINYYLKRIKKKCFYLRTFPSLLSNLFYLSCILHLLKHLM